MSDNTIDINNLDDLNNYNSIYKEKKSSLYLLISFIIIIIVCLNVLILYLMIHSSITTNSITTNSIILFATMGTIAFIGILITIFNDKFLKSDLPFLLPPELRNDQNDVSNNNKILANIILLYSLDYIEKKTIDNDVHIIALKKKKDLEVFKNSLNDKFKLLTTKYLDIINYEVNKFKEKEQRAFEEAQNQKDRDNDLLISDNTINKDNTHFAISLLTKITTKLSGVMYNLLTGFFQELIRMASNWSRPFAGFMLLVMVITIIILIVMKTQGGGGNSGTNLAGGNFVGGANNMNANKNTDIISVIMRLPDNIMAFVNNIILGYTKMGEFINNYNDTFKEIAKDFSPSKPPIIEDRPSNGTDTEKGLYDNIYTFNYEYIDKLPKINKSLIPIIGDKKLYVYNLVEPKTDIKISTYYNIDHSFNINELNGEGEYIYSLKCNDNNNGLIDSDCKIMTIDDTKCINKYEVKEEDTSDYKNIII
jgi:energy-coupling factor transporter transmembrane protein EcfT